MSRYDLVLRGGWLVDPASHVSGPLDVAIEGGAIAEVAESIPGERAASLIDVSGKTVVPGIIDPHVHVSQWLGGAPGLRMMAKEGIITALDMSGPGPGVLENVARHGCGMNIAWLDAMTFLLNSGAQDPESRHIDKAIDVAMGRGALGVKILGGHYPFSPDATARIIEAATTRGVYIAFHAGTTETGSDLGGLKEAVALAAGRPIHIPHINSYCRGLVHDVTAEVAEAVEVLGNAPNVWSESYLSRATGTSGKCVDGRPESGVTRRCMGMGGYDDTEDGLEKAILEAFASVVCLRGGENVLVTGAEGHRVWRESGTDVTISFPVNSPVSLYLLAISRLADGRFAVDSFSTDGGGIPRNTIVSHGLALVRFGAITLEEFVLKSSTNPARMLGMPHKGHLGPGADADVTVLDLERGKPVLGIARGNVIMVDGVVVGKGGTILTTQEGVRAVKETGLPYQVVDRKLFLPKKQAAV